MIEKLKRYRRKYINKSDSRINKDYLALLDETIGYIDELEKNVQIQRKTIDLLHFLYGDIRYRHTQDTSIDNISNLPDIAYDSIIKIFENRINSTGELPVEFIKEVAEQFLFWEKRLKQELVSAENYLSWNEELRNMYITLTKKDEVFNMTLYYDDIQDIEIMLRNRYISYLEKKFNYD